MSAATFQELLQQTAKTRGLTPEQLRLKLGVPRTSFGNWYDEGKEPGFARAAELLKRLGWNLEFADPTSNGPTVAAARAQLEEEYKSRVEPIIDAGQVQGGAMNAREETEERIAFEDIWRDSPWWPYTDRTKTLFTLRVAGNSMAPEYPDGSRIALRAWNGMPLPDGAPCVFRTGQGEHVERNFKLYATAPDGLIVGWPLNREHPIVVFKRTPVIEYIVLGLCNTRAHDLVRPGTDLLSKVKRR